MRDKQRPSETKRILKRLKRSFRIMRLEERFRIPGALTPAERTELERLQAEQQHEDVLLRIQLDAAREAWGFSTTSKEVPVVSEAAQLPEAPNDAAAQGDDCGSGRSLRLTDRVAWLRQEMSNRGSHALSNRNVGRSEPSRRSQDTSGNSGSRPRTGQTSQDANQRLSRPTDKDHRHSDNVVPDCWSFRNFRNFRKIPETRWPGCSTGRMSKHAQLNPAVDVPPNPSLPSEGFVRLGTILHVFPIGKSTWWAGVKSGRYPAPVKLGPRLTAWKVSDVRQLLTRLGKPLDVKQERPGCNRGVRITRGHCRCQE